jgi:transcriptional regulator with XRE-family HTH domain
MFIAPLLSGIKIPGGMLSMEDHKTLMGRRIRHLRNIGQMTQEQLGQKAGLSYKYVGAIERGEKNAPIETLIKIATALKVELHELFIFDHETEDPKVLKDKIDKMLKDVSKKEFGTIYRVIKAVLK